MNKEEKRSFLKEFRCVGGFILFFTLFSGILQGGFNLVSILIEELLDVNKISGSIINAFNYIAIIYTYYLGYRIFLKKWNNNINYKIDKKYNKLRITLDIIIAIILIRFCWILWEYFLNFINYNQSNLDDGLDFISIIYVALIAPLCEEVIMRGYVLSTLRKYGVYLSVIVSSFIFGMFHGTVSQIIPCIFIGIILSTLTLKYKSILPSIITHIITNSITILLFFINIKNAFLINIIKIFIIVLSMVILIYYLIINFKNIKELMQSIKKFLVMQFQSIAFILFILLEIFNVIMEILYNK
mgnify:FL=1